MFEVTITVSNPSVEIAKYTKKYSTMGMAATMFGEVLTTTKYNGDDDNASYLVQIREIENERREGWSGHLTVKKH